jgi:lysophospholipid hydrolase
MSLSGYLPPLCDNGNMLVDGGYLNNLPGDVIRSLGADYVLAIDVGSEESKAPVDYGDSLSGWYALLQRWNPFSKTVIPSLTDIQSRLAYVSCVKQLEEVKNMERCIYVRPPVSKYGTLEFGKFEEIYETGYRHGQELVKEWELTGLLDKLRPDPSQKQKTSGRRNSI